MAHYNWKEKRFIIYIQYYGKKYIIKDSTNLCSISSLSAIVYETNIEKIIWGKHQLAKRWGTNQLGTNNNNINNYSTQIY